MIQIESRFSYQRNAKMEKKEKADVEASEQSLLSRNESIRVDLSLSWLI